MYAETLTNFGVYIPTPATKKRELFVLFQDVVESSSIWRFLGFALTVGSCGSGGMQTPNFAQVPITNAYTTAAPFFVHRCPR